MSKNPLSELTEDGRITDDVDDLETDELVEVYGKTERIQGLINSFEMANESVGEGAPTTTGGRLRGVWNALRGRDPNTGRDADNLTELAETCSEASDAVASRIEAFQDELDDRLGDDDDIRGFQ